MKTEKVVVANLKSQGCVNKITWKLLKMAGVSSVTVDMDQSEVIVEHRECLDRAAYLHALTLLGYPEAGEENLTRQEKHARFLAA